jgi:hypothetical protein
VKLASVAGTRPAGEGTLLLFTAEAIALGAHYGQDAVFSWTPESLTIHSCVDTRRHESGWMIHY